MIQKVLIAEDHQSINISLQKTLDELAITDISIMYYCDDAFARVLSEQNAGASYDLLITDLHFETDHRAQKIQGGIALIAEVKKIQPDLKVLVFSAENKPGIVNMLFNTYDIDAYVRKARHDSEELKTAIAKMAANGKYIPRQFAHNVRQQHGHHFNEYDLTLISLLAGGMQQKNIPYYLQENNIFPSGLSSVEKRLKLIRDTLQFSKNEQLIAFCKEMGII